MEKGLYSLRDIKNLILKDKIQHLYYAQHDPYGNLVEIEFSIDNATKEGVFVTLHRFYTRGTIEKLGAGYVHLIPVKDYKYIRRNSRFL